MIFVDTSVLYEASLPDTPRAASARGALREHHEMLATSDAVLTELWNLLRARGYRHHATAACARTARDTVVLGVETGDRSRTLAILDDWPDQPFSYADGLSFALMEREGITTALTFDDHFRVYRYGAGRRRAFTVLP